MRLSFRSLLKTPFIAKGTPRAAGLRRAASPTLTISYEPRESAGLRPARRGLAHASDLKQRLLSPMESAGLRPARRAKQARRGCEPCGLAHSYDLPCIQMESAALRAAPRGVTHGVWISYSATVFFLSLSFIQRGSRISKVCR